MDHAQQYALVGAFITFVVGVLPFAALAVIAWLKAKTAELTANSNPTHSDVQAAISTAVNAALCSPTTTSGVNVSGERSNNE